MKFFWNIFQPFHCVKNGKTLIGSTAWKVQDQVQVRSLTKRDKTALCGKLQAVFPNDPCRHVRRLEAFPPSINLCFITFLVSFLIILFMVKFIKNNNIYF